MAAVGVTFVTENSNLVPTVILLGSFLVPVTFVAYAFEHRASETLTEQTILIAFVYGGVVGVLGASLLEARFLGKESIPAYLGVGLIEEGCKLAVLWYIARRLPEFLTRDGIVLGAAVGFGFAAFESAGYAFNALFTIHGLSLTRLVETQFLRGILTPLGHGLWTGILGGVLFHAAARTGRLGISPGLIVWYLVVAMLHGFWDASGGIAAVLVILLTANSMQEQLLEVGRVPQPTDQQVHLFTILTWIFLILDSVVGAALFLRLWRSGRVPAASHL